MLDRNFASDPSPAPPVSAAGELGSADLAEQPPTIKGYHILGMLGRGGMGSVWKAVQLSTRREIALKVLHGGLFAGERARRRFEREVELTAKLHHPNLARVYDSGLEHGLYFYAMELVDGIPLDHYVRRSHLAPTAVLQLVRSVCLAVEHAHQRGVIHRDLKPGNILVTGEGTPKVIDFGLARTFQEENSTGDLHLTISVDGAIFGTPAFMSPEQAAGRPLDTRSDVYSLGAILFSLLTGRGPHDLVGTRVQVLRRIAEREVPRPREANPALDRELESLLLKTLARDSDERYASVGALAQDIENYLAGEPLAAKAPTTLYFLRKRLKKHRVRVTVVVGIFAILMALEFRNARRLAWQRDNALSLAGKLEAETRQKDLTLGRGYITQGEALMLAGRWDQARGKYQQAHDAFTQLKAPTLPADLGLYAAGRRAPPPLLTFAGNRSGPLSLATLDLMEMSAPEREWATTTDSVFQDHRGAVNSVAFSPDSRLALSGGDDGTVKLWDARTGRGLRTLEDPEGPVRCVRFSPDGRLILSTGQDGAIRLWGSQGKCRTLRGHTGPVVNAAFSPDGGKIVSASADRTARVWDVERGEEIPGAGPVFDGRVTAVAFLPDGDQILVGGVDRTLTQWDLRLRKSVKTFTGHGHELGCVAISPDGTHAVSGSPDATLRRWSIAGDGPAGVFQDRSAKSLCVAFAGKGRWVAAGGSDHLVRLWDVTGGRKVVRLFAGHSDVVRGVDVSPDGQLLLSASSDGTIKLWPIKDGDNIVATGAHAAEVQHVAMSPDERTVLTEDEKGVARLWDRATGRLLVSHASGIHWLAQGGTAIGHFTPPAYPRATSALPLPDGRHVLCGRANGTLALFDTATGACIRTYGKGELDNRQVHCLVLLSDGKHVLSAGRDGRVRLWNLDSDGGPFDFIGHKDELWTLVLSQDEQFALSGGEDMSLRLWGLRQRSHVQEYAGHTGHVVAAAFRGGEDEGLVLSAGDAELSVRVWDRQTGEARGVFVLDASTAFTGAFSADGGSLVTAGVDGTVRFYDLLRARRRRELEPRFKAALTTLRDRPNDGAATAVVGEWYAFHGVSHWATALLEAARSRGAEVSSMTLARCYQASAKLPEAAREFQGASDRREAPSEYLSACISAMDPLARAGWSSSVTPGHATDQTPAAKTLIVDSAADGPVGDGDMTLRSAIERANARPGPDHIIFDIPGTGPHTIRPLKPLPPITDTVLIDARDRSGGWGPVTLDGAAAGPDAHGLDVQADHCSIRGLIIGKFGGYGIRLFGDGNVIEGNCIGIEPFYNMPLPNRMGMLVWRRELQGGGWVRSLNNVVSRNLISGNYGYGLAVSWSDATIVRGNFIGTSVAGDRAVANGRQGIVLEAAKGTIVGGPMAEEGNLISGNGYDGVYVSGGSSNCIQGNLIGTDAKGTTLLGNGHDGISIYSSSDNVIGGAAPGLRNVISGAKRNGVLIDVGEGLMESPPNANQVHGNHFGTDKTGTAVLANHSHAVVVNAGRGNQVGGSKAGEGNLISGNDGSGVVVGGSASDTSILGNRIVTDPAIHVDNPDTVGVGSGATTRPAK